MPITTDNKIIIFKRLGASATRTLDIVIPDGEIWRFTKYTVSGIQNQYTVNLLFDAGSTPNNHIHLLNTDQALQYEVDREVTGDGVKVLRLEAVNLVAVIQFVTVTVEYEVVTPEV